MSESPQKARRNPVLSSTPLPDTETIASVPSEQQQEKYSYTYYKEIFQGKSMPFAYLDLDLLDQNIRQVVANTGGKRVRLASKSLRSVAVLRHILAANPCFQGIMCFTAREAVYLHTLGFSDLLIGYPTWNEQDIELVAHAVAAGADITFMVDSIAHIIQIATIAERNKILLSVCLEIDMSFNLPGFRFGVWRSPLRTTQQLQPVLEQIQQSEFVQLVGIMGYEAQIAGVGDHFHGQKAKNTVVQALKRRSIPEIARRRAELVAFASSYGPLRFVNGGGTGSMASTRAESAVTEITVGSGFYSPGLFDNYAAFRYAPAAGFAIEIVRRPARALYTCLGGGYIASGAVGPEKLPLPYLPQGAHLLPLEGAGEVQTPIRYEGPLYLNHGDPIFLRHAKAGELCEHFTHLFLVSQGAIVDEVTTYRGDGQRFL